MVLDRMHTIQHRSLIAMASLTKVIVLSLTPTPTVVFATPLPTNLPALPPLIAWQCMSVQTRDGHRVVDPVGG